MKRLALAWLATLALTACGDEAASGIGDGGDADGGNADGGDASAVEASTPDAGPRDGSPVDGSTANRSAGCGMAPTIGTATWAPFTVAAGAMRSYFVYLPPGYDPMRAYPVIYQFHGCSSSPTRETNHPALQGQVGADAILVRGRATGDCWDLAATGPDVAFFDAMVGAVEAAFCADRDRRFATGYSSGAYMSNVLGCVRGAELRAIANIAGGKGGGTCTGTVAALVIHDTDDPTVVFSNGLAVRDWYVTRNGCNASAPPTPVAPAPCAAYTGCAAGTPVTWCQTSGQQHGRQDTLSAPAFWGFLRQF